MPAPSAISTPFQYTTAAHGSTSAAVGSSQRVTHVEIINDNDGATANTNRIGVGIGSTKPAATAFIPVAAGSSYTVIVDNVSKVWVINLSAGTDDVTIVPWTINKV